MLRFKVLDLAISDRNSNFCFAYLFIYLFILFFSEHISTKKKVYFDLSSGHLETASWIGRVEGCFDFFTARFH